MENTVNILDTKINAIDKNGLKTIVNDALTKKKGIKIFTPNTDIVLKANNDPNLQTLLEEADIRIADGAGLVIASKLLGTPIPERLAGIELGEYLLKKAEELGLSIFLLGGSETTVERAKAIIKTKYTEINICGTQHGYFDVYGEENNKVLEKILNASPDILFVCMGFPRQEKWIAENSKMIPSLSLSIGLGGSLDVWSGNIRRAPLPFRKLSLEWLWRILMQPKRVFFLFKIPVFFSKVIAQRYRNILKKAKLNSKNVH